MKKTDNHNLHSKLELRRLFLGKLNPGFSVLDAFSGSSESIWTVLRKEYQVGNYLALDIKRKNKRLKMDSLKYLRNQKWEHDVIDLDAYGSPWAHWLEVLKRGRKCVVFLTIGSSGMGAQAHSATRLAGIPVETPVGIHRQISNDVVNYCLAACCKYDMDMEQCKEALNPGGNARYLGLMLNPRTHEPNHQRNG